MTGQLVDDGVVPLVPRQFGMQADTDIAEVVVCLRHRGFRYRHLSTQVSRILTSVAQVARQRIRHAGQHAGRHRRAAQLGPVPDQRAYPAQAVGTGVGAQCRAGLSRRRQQAGLGAADQLAVRAGGGNSSAHQRAGGLHGHCLHRRAAAQQRTGQCRRASAVAQRMRNLHHHHGRRNDDVRDTAYVGEHMHPPRHPAQVQLLVGQPGHRIQAALPAVVVKCTHDELLRRDIARHPPRVAQRAVVPNAQAKFVTGRGPATQLPDRALDAGGHPVEREQQELVVGHLGRHPVGLRVDGRHPAAHGRHVLVIICG